MFYWEMLILVFTCMLFLTLAISDPSRPIILGKKILTCIKTDILITYCIKWSFDDKRLLLETPITCSTDITLIYLNTFCFYVFIASFFHFKASISLFISITTDYSCSTKAYHLKTLPKQICLHFISTESQQRVFVWRQNLQSHPSVASFQAPSSERCIMV